MVKYSSPSDTKTVTANYSTGLGYYTNSNRVAGLLQVPNFTASSNPSVEDIGEIIRRVEDLVDTKCARAWRPIIYKNEYHNFELGMLRRGGGSSNYRDYVGICKLDNTNIRKILRLEVWKGNTWEDLASATANLTITDATNITSIVFALPDGAEFTILPSTSNNDNRFLSNLGTSTSCEELISLINEVHPATTAGFTGATNPKSLSVVHNSVTKNISSYFYATKHSEESGTIVISSLLPGTDGSACTCTVVGDGAGDALFTGNEEMKRLGEFWKDNTMGMIYFRTDFPYVEKNSIRVTYIAGDIRVPAIITDAATKLSAAELLRHDDSTILIADTGDGIDLKTKYDSLVKEAYDILESQKHLAYVLI
tara:strand:- start:46885 stop:47985 length:1101 start_codon:yes stop_codon:yes gene_type:complete